MVQRLEVVDSELAPPVWAALRNEALQVAKSELAAQDEFPHVVVNDRLEDAVEALAAIVASGAGGLSR